jgi:hypothetical protein
MSADSPRAMRFRRVVMAFDSRLDDVVTLEAAVTVATRLHAETKVIFVEDEEMLRAAAYPTVTTFGVSSETQQAEFVAIERAARSQAMRQCRVFEEVSRRRGLKAVPEIRRGRMATEVLTIGDEADLLVIGRAAPKRWHSLASPRLLVLAALQNGIPVLLLHPSMRSSGAIAVVYDGGMAAERTLDVAADLAEEVGGLFVVALASSSGDDAMGWREGIAEQLRDREIDPAFDVIASTKAQDVLDWARGRQAGLVVVSRDQQVASDDQLEEILDKFPTSLLLLP